jgi:hypothetical protein
MRSGRASVSLFQTTRAGVREVLQAVDHALIDAANDDHMIVTNRGSFYLDDGRTRAHEQTPDDRTS